MLMGNETDDPGPNRNCFAGSDHQLFSGVREIIDKKDDGTVGISHYVCDSTDLRGIRMVLLRNGLLLPKPYLRVSVL